MLKYYKYTDKEKEILLKSMTVLVDTREKKNDHIISYFDKKKIPYKTKALHNGDYSFYIPQNSELNIERDLYFDKDIMIERKQNLEELSGNITQNRSRFEEELSSFSGKKYLMIENASYSDILTNNYTTNILPKSFLGTLHTYNHRYGLEIIFMNRKEYSPIFIYYVLNYYLRNILR